MGRTGLETRVTFTEDASPGQVFSRLLDETTHMDMAVAVLTIGRIPNQPEGELQAWPNGDGFFSLRYFMGDAQQPTWTTRIDDQGNKFQTRGTSSDEVDAVMRSLVTEEKMDSGTTYAFRIDDNHHLAFLKRDFAVGTLR